MASLQLVGGIGSGKCTPHMDSVVVRSEHKFVTHRASEPIEPYAEHSQRYTVRKMFLKSDKFNAGTQEDRVQFLAPEEMSDHEAVKLMLDKARRFDIIADRYPEVAARHL